MQQQVRPGLRFIVLLGVVSLFADMTYEGARSITGPYLAVLGAGAGAVGALAGLGELVGYALRLASGWLADRTRRYWALTLVGYAVNLIAVPLLALAGRWQTAALLIIAERAGKALRTPARDAMLSYATREVGRGRGFGLHEALDQIGALAGPLFVAWVLYGRGGYARAFGLLLIPALAAVSLLLLARRLYPQPRELEPVAALPEARGLPREFWLCLAGAALVAAGYADFALAAFHLERAGLASDAWIPLFYAIAMGVDAVAALGFGRVFDRLGVRALAIASLASAPSAPLIFLGGAGPAVGGIILWGVGMGAQESILRAAVAQMTRAEQRGAAYGTFHATFGLSWFAGSAVLGALYEVSRPALAVFSASLQLASIALFLAAMKSGPRKPGKPRDANSVLRSRG